MTTATLTKKQEELEEQQRCADYLRELFAKDTSGSPRVRTILRHVSSSGMSRDISVIYCNADGIHNLTYYAAKALGWTLKTSNGFNAIRVGGCGMDMGFHLVYTLSRVLYRDSNPNQDGRDAGYYLNQDWL